LEVGVIRKTSIVQGSVSILVLLVEKSLSSILDKERHNLDVGIFMTAGLLCRTLYPFSFAAMMSGLPPPISQSCWMSVWDILEIKMFASLVSVSAARARFVS